jgi:hypothetical protein
MTGPSQVQDCRGPQRSLQQAQVPCCPQPRHSVRLQALEWCRLRPSCQRSSSWCRRRGSKRVMRGPSVQCRWVLGVLCRVS